MSKNKEPYIVFEEPNHVLSALYHAGERVNKRYFPVQEVLKVSKQGWAVPQNLVFAEKIKLNNLSKQFGWKYRTVEEQPHGELLPLWRLLIGAWYYQDPYLDSLRIPGNPAFSTHEFTQYDPNNDLEDEHTYLLGAKTEHNATELLKVLTGLLVQDIRAVPLLLEGDSGQSPFKFFWSVTMTHSLVTALQIADRAWWKPGVRGKGETEIFLEWPYSLGVPGPCLNMFNWGSNVPLVLISRNEPHILLLRPVENQPAFSNLIDVASLEVDEHLLLQRQSISTTSDLELKVRVRLIDEYPQRTINKRINNLKSEIEAKKSVLSYIQQRESESADLEQTGEPLFLYYDEGNGIPFELRRLLLEWADQAEALRSLRYQKIEGPSFPDDILSKTDAKNPVIHVLTTEKALGKQGSSHLGVMLGEYSPAFGERFTLLPRWAQFDLRLFIPCNENLVLYPELYPSDVAANKLEKALLSGETGKGRYRSIVLFMRGKKGNLHALQLRIDDFQSLLDAYEWNCSLDFRTDAVDSAKITSLAVSNMILGTVKNMVTSSMDAYISSLEDENKKEIQQKIENFERRIAEREGKLSDLNTSMVELQTTHENLAQVAAELTEFHSRFLPDIHALAKQKKSMVDILNEINRLADRLKKQSVQRNQIAGLIRRFRDR